MHRWADRHRIPSILHERACVCACLRVCNMRTVSDPPATYPIDHIDASRDHLRFHPRIWDEGTDGASCGSFEFVFTPKLESILNHASVLLFFIALYSRQERFLHRWADHLRIPSILHERACVCVCFRVCNMRAVSDLPATYPISHVDVSRCHLRFHPRMWDEGTDGASCGSFEYSFTLEFESILNHASVLFFASLYRVDRSAFSIAGRIECEIRSSSREQA